jgi:DNA-binding CsgD family transcriptional regulator
MAIRIEAFIERINSSTNYENLFATLLYIRDALHVSHIVYHSINRNGEPFALASYSAEWASFYEGDQLFKIDPVVLTAFQKFHPYSWKNLDWGAKPARRLMFDAVDGGVGNQGLSLPIRGPGGEFSLMSVSHSCTDGVWLKFIDNHLSDMLLLAHYIHYAARKIEFPDGEQIYSNLSPRELDALQMLGTGLNRARVAETLKISEHTLRVYIESARHKLCAANTTHAVAKAVSSGLIAI